MFLADDSVTGRTVALKFYNPDRRNPTDAYRWECFEREARILARLKGQQDIIQIIADRSQFTESIPTSVGIPLDITFAYYALEKAETDVSAKIAKGEWTLVEILEAFHVMCRSIQRIHLHHLVHRDLKPDNFLVMPSGNIKLSDFGTARFLDGSEAPLLAAYDQRIPGEVRYVAPEIWAGLHDVDPSYAFKADIFSLGAILFEMLTGINLGVQLFGPALLTAFAQHMNVIPRTERKKVYLGIVSTIATAYPLPTLGAFAPHLPGSIRHKVDQLYRDMCHFDFQVRMSDFNSILRQVDTCILILKNEEKYRRWRDEMQKRRTARLSKRRGTGR
jgi:serine/threonine protein kinase